jgi:alpha-glucosidase
MNAPSGKILIFVLTAVLGVSILQAKSISVLSPNKRLTIQVNLGQDINYGVYYDNKELVAPSPVSLTLAGGIILGKNPAIEKNNRTSVDDEIIPVVKEKRSQISNRYNETMLYFKGNYGIIFRAFDDAAAYRFFTFFQEKIRVYNEQATFRLTDQDSIYFPFEPEWQTSFERLYSYVPVTQIGSDRKGFTPVVIVKKNGLKMALAEADVDDYPGMFLTGTADESTTLTATFAKYPLKEEQIHNQNRITERANYIAVTNGTRMFPWRIIAVAEYDGDLIGNDIVYRLGPPMQIDDPSWIKPGKVAWDWWNDWNVYGVGFRAGINTDTYKYYIDFASKYKIEYIIMDAGWSDASTLLKSIPEIDMNALLQYANDKNVGIILWVHWQALQKEMQAALDQFEIWGIRGIKVDYMDRDDQPMANFYREVTEETAKRHLLVDFHGAFKPTGLRRAFPNLITREGVRGLEYCKWADDESPEFQVTIPFIRMLAGPMDFTPGAMRNAARNAFRPMYTRPMSQGTRCQQLAMYVVYESPLQMLCDSPSNYYREPEMMNFLSRVPTVWDETRVLAGKIADYVLLARRSGDEWYIGAMSDWTPRELTVDLSFLGKGSYGAEIYADGINADRFAEDYTLTTKSVTARDKLVIKLAPGGGWAAWIYPN